MVDEEEDVVGQPTTVYWTSNAVIVDLSVCVEVMGWSYEEENEDPFNFMDFLTALITNSLDTEFRPGGR